MAEGVMSPEEQRALDLITQYGEPGSFKFEAAKRAGEIPPDFERSYQSALSKASGDSKVQSWEGPKVTGEQKRYMDMADDARAAGDYKRAALLQAAARGEQEYRPQMTDEEYYGRMDPKEVERFKNIGSAQPKIPSDFDDTTPEEPEEYNAIDDSKEAKMRALRKIRGY